jgi:acetoacetate decarboxylase
MRGRTIALWYRLEDPDEARRHVPPFVDMEDDPIVRARFWDMEHDAVVTDDGAERPWRRFREAVVAFPVRSGSVSGDYPTYMYGDDAVYAAFGREVMGWPVRDGVISVDPEPEAGPGAGVRIGGRLERDGTTVMTAAIVLSGEQVVVDETAPPRWLATKVIPDVAGPGASVAQLVATGPERIHHRRIWVGDGSLGFEASPNDELGFLAPREIVQAQYWSDVELTIGWGEVIEELGDRVWDG